ncbi:putative poly(A) polymerase-like [Capsicum annuum]|uniref:DELLA protein RGL1-like n=1 Tax=Capsicum annuum TaxID=4072 RepID=UPI001FB13FC0|nr:DELLA protein RGL1-like [Capsicum annuum]KAF3651165.1 putative poly(A) polymerase-like [Capsicum annuum]
MQEQNEQDFVTLDDWDFDVEEETTNVVYVKETIDDNKKARSSSIPSLNILKDFGNGFRKLKGQKINVHTSESAYAPRVCKLSTDEILRLGGQKFIQSTESSVSGLDHPFGGALFSLRDEDYSRSVELVERLLASAEKVEEKLFDRAINLLNECEKLSSKSGNPVERLVYYFSGALRERVDRETGKESTKSVGLHDMQDLQNALRGINACTIAVQDMPICQVVKFAGIQAIVENIGNAKKVHIIDLEIKMGVQWTILMQALTTHPKNSQNHLEYLKITALLSGVDQSRTNVEETGKRLMSFAESFHIALCFKIVEVEDVADLKREDLDIDPDEVIAVYSQYFMSNLLTQQEKLDSLIGFIGGLNPRIMIVAEVEANLNSPVFANRFIEALFYHGAFFDLFEDCMKNDESTRMAMESEVMWHGIRNIIAVEGEERRIRHVSIQLWREYFKRFGMVEIRMSNSSLYQAKVVVDKFSGGNSFTLQMNENYLAIGWKGIPLNSLSAWKFRKRNPFHGVYLTL